MSVYTTVSPDELRAFLADYPVGELVDYCGISAGIENTNYFVDTSDGHWVLTLFERQADSDLPYFLGLMDHLARRGIPSACPAEDNQGRMLRELNGRPAALVHRLDGDNVLRPGPEHCAQLGHTLAELHLAAGSYPQRREPDHGPQWCTRRAADLRGRLDDEAQSVLREELAVQAGIPRSDLPSGIVHADLFRDNALFDDDRLSGLIDFYYACNDALLYDLAVIVNDWCFDESGFLGDNYAALADAYHATRPFEEGERRVWSDMLRCAALRFWLSRLYDQHYPRDGELTHIKNPDEFRQRIDWHRGHPDLELA